MKPNGIVIAAAGLILAMLWQVNDRPRPAVLAAEIKPPQILIDYPQNDSIFPPEITPPTFIWRDNAEGVNRWHIEVYFSDGSSPIHAESSGPPISIGEIDQRCISARNELPKLSPEQAAAHTWIPDEKAWQRIKQHSVAGAAQLLCGCQTCGSRADDGDAFSCAHLWRLGPNPSFFEATLDDVLFDLLDCHRRVGDAEDACGFAGSGANASGEFRKIIGRMKLPHGFFPSAAVYKVVPVRDQVVDRASGVAEGDATIHATGALSAQFVFGGIDVNLKPVIHALGDGAALGMLWPILDESRRFTHVAPARPGQRPAAADR